MAKIYALPNAKAWEDFNQHEALYAPLARKAAALKDGEYNGAIIEFAVADGRAAYLVQSLKPLVICHIPYMDAYRAHPLIEKGLNVAEVKKMVDQARRFNKLFAKKSGGANGRE